MSPITDDEVVERVAEAIYDHHAGVSWWIHSREEVKEHYRKIARSAIDAHKKAYHTPYVDECHQGGDLLDFVIQVSARTRRAEEELGAVRRFCVEKAGEYLPEDTTVLKAVELLQNATAGWKALAQQYGEEIVSLREELAQARDIARVNDFEMLQGQYTRAAADLAEERARVTDLVAEVNQRQRRGQAAMNVLAIVRPDLCSVVSGTETDPFHLDERLDKFFDWLRTLITLEERVARDRGVRHGLADVAKEMGVNLNDDFPGRGGYC